MGQRIGEFNLPMTPEKLKAVVSSLKIVKGKKRHLLKLKAQAFLFDYLLAYIIGQYLLSFSDFFTLFKAISETVPPYSWWDSEVWSYFPYSFLIMCLGRFYFALIFGIGPGAYLIGLRQSGDTFSSRVQGAIKIILQAILFPIFPVVVFFSILGIDPYEKFLGSTLIYRSGKKGFVFFSIPPLCVTSLMAPLLTQLIFLQDLDVQMQEVEKAKLAKGLDYSSYKNFQSNLFKVKAFSSLGDGRFLLLPSMQVAKVLDKARLRPTLMIYDTSTDAFGELTVGQRFSLFGAIQEARRNNPFFSLSYPTLDRILGDSKWKYQLKAYKGENNPLGREGREEIRSLISSSFRLSRQNFIGHIISHGPFIHGHVRMRNALMALVDNHHSPEVSFMALGKEIFLRFKSDLRDRELSELKIRESLIPMGTNNALVLQFDWNGAEDSSLAARQFYSQFFSAATWYFDYDQVFPFSTKSALGPLEILDFFGRRFKDERLSFYEQNLYSYFYNHAQRAVLDADEGPRLFIAKALQRFIRGMDLINGKDAFYSDKVYQLLQKLLVAIETNNRDYFQK